jgi:hypothetical protein
MGSIQTGYYKFDSATIITLASDTATITQAAHIIAAETGTADNLTTITGISGVTAPYFVVLQADAGDTITVKNGTGNVNLNGGADFDLSGNKTLALWFDGTNWSDIGAGGGSGSGSGVNFGSASSLTIATGTVTRGASSYYLSIDTEAAAASDDLDTINSGGASAGIAIMIKAANTARTVVIKHNTGNIQLNGGLDFSLDNTEKAVLLFWDGTNWIGIGVPISGGGGGTVTSVALTVPVEFSVSGSPVTTSGTLAVSKASQTQNTAFAAPDGSSGAPTFRSLVAADLPSTAVTPGAYTSANITVDAQGRLTAAANGSGGAAPDYILIRDEKAQNTAGGTFTSGAWQTRTLNTKTNDAATRASITKLAFTSGGTYEVVVGDTITGATSSATATVFDVELTSGTWAGGTAAGNLWLNSQSGTFQAENLNVGANTNVATIAGDSTLNQIRLKAGTYQCFAQVPGVNCVEHQSRLQNISDTATTLLGSSQRNAASTNTNGFSNIMGRFTIAAAKTFEVQHRCSTTAATNGFGYPSNLSTEIYTIAEFKKEA